MIVMMSQHDSIINTQSLVKVFDKALTNPASKIIWYGKLPDGKYSKKVVAKSDYLPELRIKSFAHMSIPFSPDNVWYGKDGKFRYCRNSASAKDVQTAEMFRMSGMGPGVRTTVSTALLV